MESEAEHLNGPLRNVLKTLSAATESASAEMKTVCIPAHHFEKMSVAELKGLLGHEMGHVVRQDTHVRRGLEMFRRTNQASERLADDIGVYLSKEPEAMKAGLDKTCQLQEEAIKNLPNNFWARVQKRYMRNFTSDKSTATYPSLSERKRAIDTMAGRISTSEGRSHVEAELSRRLETEHRKLFPHHFSRI